MSQIVELWGSFAPILTPFTATGDSIDLESYERQLSFLQDSGLTGVLVLGTNGEFGWLSNDERLSLVEATLSAGTRLKVIVGGIVPDSPEQTLAQIARLAGYAPRLAAILVAPPFYHAYASGEGVPGNRVVDFYRRLTEVQDQVPLLLYNVPVPPGGPVTAAVTPDVVAALKDEVAIAGVKDSTGCLENIPAYQDAKPGLQVLIGSDHAVAVGMALGAVGSITACANVFPSAVLVVHQARTGPQRDAAQAELSRLRRVLELVPGKLVSTQKHLVHHLGVVADRSPVRDQGRELTPEEWEQVLGRLETAAAGLVLNSRVREKVRQAANRAGR